MVIFAFLFSLLTFVGSLIAIPWLVARLDSAYFRAFTPQAATGVVRGRRGAFLLWALMRNTCGLVLAVLGVLMLVLPGQGIITLVLGLSLLDFPGKSLLLAWILQRKAVQRALNWLRRKQGKEEFLFS
ncbi:MAG: hypothetical protein GX087_06500 [Desulfobulbaceae bacterium]|nr:hypothetical protein [Desulfobulbaceae bacterium]